jgi:hypothetical protein
MPEDNDLTKIDDLQTESNLASQDKMKNVSMNEFLNSVNSCSWFMLISNLTFFDWCDLYSRL